MAASDFAFLMDREGISADLTKKFTDAGIDTVRLFASLVSDSAGLRKLLSDDFGIDLTTLAGKVTVARIVVAWEAAKARSAKYAEVEAETEVRQEAKPLRQSDFKSMRDAYESRWWKLESKQVPSRIYVEKVGDGIEKGDPRAELLSEVTNREEGDTDVMKAVFDSGGTIKAIRATSTIPFPKDAEELRARISLLGRAWCFVAFQQPNCKWLKDLCPQDFQEYLDYLLGPYVHKLAARDEQGNQTAAPPWNLLLSYELEIRRRAMVLVGEGLDFRAALKAAYRDPVVKERHFTTPLATAATLRGAKRQWSDVGGGGSGGSGNGGKGRGKGGRGNNGGKGKSKGGEGGKGRKGKTPADGCNSRTPDGKPICYPYNKAEGCDRRDCPFLHVCGRCFKRHSMQECTESN